MTKRTQVIELWGGPGCGKSTLAAAVFAEMKNRGLSVELVREYAKAWAWRGEPIRAQDELYIFAKQLREESNVYGKVDWIVTDRPLALSIVYARMYTPESEMMRTTVNAVLREQPNVHRHSLLVERRKAYVSAGRFESEAGARTIDRVCRDVMPNVSTVSKVADVFAAVGL